MSRRAKVLSVVGVIFLVVVTIVAVKKMRGVWAESENSRKLAENTGPAAPYRPQCTSGDAALCAAWTQFRSAHPYPYQAVAAKPLGDGTFMLVVSEPSPDVYGARLDGLIHAAFGKDIKIHKEKWYIGADGWLEDVVFRTAPVAGKPADPLDDPQLRDRLAVLNQALFGTTFGADVEVIAAAETATLRRHAPNVGVSPREIVAWLKEDSMRWHPVDATSSRGMSWAQIRASQTVGALGSEDGTLVMLTFPTRYLHDARKGASIEALRIPFRKFAVTSETIVGGIWTHDEQTAIFGRLRTQPLSVIPPLRFETFALLAGQSADELAQSYERNTMMAGKLFKGEHKYRDWAPIYLSAALIDSEFGALLNITDQMLKSWSEAGRVEYLYFTYPKPGQFPFSNQPLSKVLREKHKSTGVLFNWNTAGSAVVVKDGDSSILTAKQTGALPVTYGADGKTKAQGGADVFAYEDEAYQYFAGLNDPNLARVVQYTVLYQTFRAIAAHAGETDPESTTFAPIPARAAATALLVSNTTALLDDLEGGRIDVRKSAQLQKFIDEQVRPQLATIRSAFPDATNAMIAGMLVDRSSPLLRTLIKSRIAELKRRSEELEVEETALNADIENYNAAVDARRAREESKPKLGDRDLASLYYGAPGELPPGEPRTVTVYDSAPFNTSGGPKPPAYDPEVAALLEQIRKRRLSKSKSEQPSLADIREDSSLLHKQTSIEERQRSLSMKVNAYNLESRAFQNLASSGDPLGDLRKPLQQIALISRDVERVRKEFIETNAKPPQGSIKTPSIVLSWNSEDARQSIGGHNVKARALEFEPVKGIKGIKLVDKGNGRTVLQYDPSRAKDVELHAAELARAVEHRGIRDATELMKMSEVPARLRPRPEALKLSKPVPIQEQVFGRFGERPVVDRKPFVDELRSVAEKNDCCVFVARDAREVAYVAEPHPTPPPGVRVVEIRDTPSLVDHVSRWSGKAGTPAEKAVIFLGAKEAHVEALAANVNVAANARLMSVVEAVGPAAKQGKRPGAIVQTDLGGRRSVLRVVSESIGARTRAVLEHLGVRREPAVWRRATVERVEGERLQQILQGTGWNQTTDGAPTAFKLSFARSPEISRVDVLAGFAEGHVTTGAAQLREAHTAAATMASRDGATLAQYLMTIRNRLQGMPQAQLKRLVMVVEDQEGRTVLARLDLSEDVRPGA